MSNPVGRPTIYSEELADRICDAIATSKDGLDIICDRESSFPCSRTIQLWCFRNPGFFRKYIQARKFQAHTLMDNILTAANNDKDDTLIKINRARVKIDAYKITSARFNVEEFGDKATQTHDVTVRQDEALNKVKENLKSHESK